MTTVVIMQPNYFPWVGLFEQVRLADVFVHFDDAQFSKGGLTNRVKIKTPAGPKWMTVPLKDHHLGDTIAQTHINHATDWRHSQLDMLRQSYRGSPHLNDMLDLVAEVHAADHDNIADLDIAAIECVCAWFNITPRFERSSTLNITTTASQRVLDIVKAFAGDTYVTGHGAKNYLDHEGFDAAGVSVRYMDYQRKPYPQQHGPFDPHMSILDLIANVGPAGLEYICSPTIPWIDFVHG